MTSPVSRPLAVALAAALSLGLGAAAVQAAAVQAAGAGSNAAANDDLSLEDLLKADVVTASRKAQAVQDVAAAVYVISREDIERSGATSLPAALALAPGVSVQRLASNRWAVSVRGFNGRFANKLLVLLDGRSIYSPLFSGVLWELEGTLMEDIDRIEVVRGPVAAMWGANAVNGVINIITRHSRDTQGSLVAAGTGSVERGSLALRHGGTLGGSAATGTWRAWATRQIGSRFEETDGTPSNDDWRTTRIGGRADLTLPGGDTLMLSAGVLDTQVGDRWSIASLTAPSGVERPALQQPTSGSHVLARWSRLGGNGSETVVQAWATETRLRAVDFFEEKRHTVDLDVQHRPRPQGAHDLVLGGSWRLSRDHIGSSGIFSVQPERRTSTIGSLFVNDEITLVPERLRATLGARLEHNSYTGWEPQPHARIAWTPDASRTLWAAVSGAARTPRRAELDAQVDLSVAPATATTPAVLLRNTPPDGHRLEAEHVQAFELGWRQQFAPGLALDLALFHARYTELAGAALGGQSFEMLPYPHAVQAVVPGNALRGHTHGVEAVLDWRVQRGWRLQASYTQVRTRVDAPDGDPVALASAQEQAYSTPVHQLALRSALALSATVDADVRLRRVSAISGPGVQPIAAYTGLDLRLAWRARPGLTLALTGENLLERRHVEGSPELLPSPRLQVPRAAHVKAVWTF